MTALAVAGAVATAASTVRAAPRDHVIESFSGEAGAVTVDWTRGLVIANGVAGADLRAPSPAVARVAAERRALTQARAALEARAREIALAGGGKLGERAGADPAVARRLERAIARALTLAVRHGSDGSVIATAAVPVEALRLAALGVPEVTFDGDADADAPTALIVDARGAARRKAGAAAIVTPRLGQGVAIAGEAYRGPVVYVASMPAARRDARLGPRVVTATLAAPDAGTGSANADGAIAVALADAASPAVTAARLARANALVVIVTGAAKPRARPARGARRKSRTP